MPAPAANVPVESAIQDNIWFQASGPFMPFEPEERA